MYMKNFYDICILKYLIYCMDDIFLNCFCLCIIVVLYLTNLFLKNRSIQMEVIKHIKNIKNKQLSTFFIPESLLVHKQ